MGCACLRLLKWRLMKSSVEVFGDRRWVFLVACLAMAVVVAGHGEAVAQPCGQLCEDNFWHQVTSEKLLEHFRQGETFWQRDGHGETPLHHAVRVVQDTDVVALLIRAGIAIDAPDWLGMTPLHEAASAANADTVKVLLELGADPNKRDALGMTPLHRAVMPMLVPALIDQESLLESEGSSAALEVARASVVRILLEGGSELGARSAAGETALEIAAASGVDVLSLRELLQEGADPNVLDSDRRTPLHRAAAWSGTEVVVELLASGAAPADEDRFGLIPLHLASQANMVGVLIAQDAPINATDAQSWTPLHWAAAHGSVALVRALLERGAAVTATSRQGATPLHEASYHAADVEVVMLLLRAGSVPRAPDNAGLTALHYASKRADVMAAAPIIETLLDGGASVAAQDHSGNQPLHLAALHSGGEITRVLVERGADISASNNQGDTSLHLAAGRKDALGPEQVAALLASGAIPWADISNGQGDTPLHVAARESDRPESLDLLLALEGVDVDAVNLAGETSLYQAVGRAQVEVIEVLLGAGADPNLADLRGWTPLRAAGLRGELCPEITAMLVGAGATRDGEGCRGLGKGS